MTDFEKRDHLFQADKFAEKLINLLLTDYKDITYAEAEFYFSHTLDLFKKQKVFTN